jgi:hypothetical protein
MRSQAKAKENKVPEITSGQYLFLPAFASLPRLMFFSFAVMVFN